MTGPADDGELVVKMLNSGAPGVMLDLEDSMANRWSSLMTGVQNIRSALYGELGLRRQEARQAAWGSRPPRPWCGIASAGCI
jgi:malate synthase